MIFNEIKLYFNTNLLVNGLFIKTYNLKMN